MNRKAKIKNVKNGHVDTESPYSLEVSSEIKTEPQEEESEIAETSVEMYPNYYLRTEIDQSVEDPLDVGSKTKDTGIHNYIGISKMSKKQNYTIQEKDLLVRLVDEHKDIVESKETNAVSSRMKEDTWNLIATKFNSRRLNRTRDMNSLRKLWSNIKQEARKKSVQNIQDLYKTGGGSSDEITEKSTLDELAYSNIKPLTGLRNGFDSDEIVTQDTPVNFVTIQTIPTNGSSQIPVTTDLAETNKSINVANSRKWANKRPKIDIITPIEKAKLDYINLQMELLKKEDERKEVLFQLDKKIKEKMYENLLNQ